MSLTIFEYLTAWCAINFHSTLITCRKGYVDDDEGRLFSYHVKKEDLIVDAHLCVEDYPVSIFAFIRVRLEVDKFQVNTARFFFIKIIVIFSCSITVDTTSIYYMV